MEKYIAIILSLWYNKNTDSFLLPLTFDDRGENLIKERVVPSVIALIAAYVIAGAALVLGIGHLTAQSITAATVLGLYGTLFLAMALCCALTKPQTVRRRVQSK